MRTQEAIQKEIELQVQQKMPELDSTSKTAIWRLWVAVVAYAIWMFEQLVRKDMKSLEQLTETRRYGRLDWYADEAKKFQLGDPIHFDSRTGLIGYKELNAKKQIIKRATVTELADGTLLLKVAKEKDGELTSLEELTELIPFKNYIQQIKVAGTVIDTLSLEADVIDGTAEIYYDGNYTEVDIKERLKAVLIEYRDAIGFDGVIILNDLIDKVRENVIGIDDIYFNEIKCTPQGGQAVVFTRKYLTKAGYFNYADDWIDNWTFTPRFGNL